MIDTKKIVESAESKLAQTDMFVVGCTCSPSNEIDLYIDSDTKVSIDICISLSRAIEAEFDREVEDFSLTVASAGIGSELKLLRQYNRLIGSSVEVLLKDGIKIIAKLIAVDEQQITLSYQEKQVIETASGKKKKQLVEVEKVVAFDDIKYTKEYLDFK
ncbi:MAG: ribosome assembly cofactor RimP [Rikenellaceae bacterium]